MVYAIITIIRIIAQGILCVCAVKLIGMSMWIPTTMFAGVFAIEWLSHLGEQAARTLRKREQDLNDIIQGAYKEPHEEE